MQETRKHLLGDDIFVPELKKRIIDIKVKSVETGIQTKEKPCVIEMGILPPASNLEESEFSLKKQGDSYKISGTFGENIVYKQIEDRTDYMKYAIGIRKRGTDKIDIIPVEHFNVQQTFETEEGSDATQGSYLQQKIELNQSFGTSRSGVNKRLKNMMQTVSGTHDVEREQIEAGNEEEKQQLNPSDYPDIPFFDASTTDKTKVYPLDNLMTPDEKTYFSNCAREVRDKIKSKDVVGADEVKGIIKTTKFGASYVESLSQMEKVRFLTVVTLLEFYRTLQVMVLNGPKLKNEKSVMGVASENKIDETILVGLCDRLLEKVDTKDGFKKFNFSTLSKTLITNTALVVALHIVNFTLTMPILKLIGVDFQLTDAITTKHLTRLGCVRAYAAADGAKKKDLAFALKAPLVIVSEEKKRGGSSKKKF